MTNAEAVAGPDASQIESEVPPGSSVAGTTTTGVVPSASSPDGQVDPVATGGPSTQPAQTSTGVAPSATASAAPTLDPAIINVNPPPFIPLPGQLRRLTRAQFHNAIRDVFGYEVDVNELDADNWSGDFATVGAGSVVTSERGVEQYSAAVEAAVSWVFDDEARRAGFIGCTPSSADDACALGFIEQLSRKAWRRTPTDPELERLNALASSVSAELSDATQGLRWVTVALFTSPNFLYRAELGELGADGVLRFSAEETAARLAFLVTNSTPNDELLAAASAGALASAEGQRLATEQLLDSPAGRAAIGAFAEEYLRLDRIATQAKDEGLFPEYGQALRAGMVADMRHTWEAIAFDGAGSALDVFSTTQVFVNSELAALYGLDATGLDSTTFASRELPADGARLGILSKAAFLSQFANQKEGSPTLRGKFMRQALLCMTVPPPPGDVDLVLDEPPADQPQTKRQRLESHRSNKRCAGCHALMDPLGLPFENFDAIGRYRTTDHGLPIDASGDFEGVAVADARELALSMDDSAAVARCIVRKYYSYALGALERDEDGSALNDVSAHFQASGYQLRQLVLAVATHAAFSSVATQADFVQASP